MKLGVVIALIAGLIAAVYLYAVIGFGAVWDAVARAGLGGLFLLCLCQLAVTGVLALAWWVVVPPAFRLSLGRFFLARQVREAIAEISPFSPVGGLVTAVRLAILYGMNGAYAAASVTADMTTEAMAQVPFLAFGVALSLRHLGELPNSDALLTAMVAVLVLAVPAIVLLVMVQRRGAGLAERMAARFLPGLKQGAGFGEAIHALYDSPARLAVSATLHLVAWMSAGLTTYVAFRLVGGKVSLINAMALEALLCTLRSVAAFVPAAIGVQEAGYAMLAPLFGLPAELGLAVSLLKRAREITLGVPALLYWQGLEGRAALRKPDPAQ